MTNSTPDDLDIFSITKRIEGFSCCFRNWKTESHCHYLHGYSPVITMGLSSQNLNNDGWVFDFAGFRELKEFLTSFFDHTVIIATDDPQIEVFKKLNADNTIQLRLIDGVSCEHFAKMIYEWMTAYLLNNNHQISVDYVEFSENNTNSARYTKNTV